MSNHNDDDNSDLDQAINDADIDEQEFQDANEAV